MIMNMKLENEMVKSEQDKIIKKLASRDIWDQLHQVQEECAELIVAISHMRRKKGENTYDNVCREVADVKIMVDQMSHILDGKLIDKIVGEKLTRAKERIESGQL